MKSKSRKDDRRAFFDALDAGEIPSLPDTVRRMRKSIGLTQTEYAKLAGVAPRVLMDLERGAGNPTLNTLEKLAAPFGLRVGLVLKGRSD
jgi:transcriptional regulator with XRE-family HTH domain